MNIDAQLVQRLYRALREPSRWRQRARCVVDLGRAQLLFRGCHLGREVGASGYVHVLGTVSRIHIGNFCRFAGGPVPSCLHSDAEGVIDIGAESLVNYGSLLRARTRIQLGKRCMLASFVVIRDANDALQAPIIIDDDVWIAHGAVIEPGVHIGRGSVVAARSVVTRNIPERSLAIGNPARAMPLRMVDRRARCVGEETDHVA